MLPVNKKSFYFLIGLLTILTSFSFSSGNFPGSRQKTDQDSTLYKLQSDSASSPDTLQPEIKPDEIMISEPVLEPVLYRFGGDTLLSQAYLPENQSDQKFPSPTFALFKSVLFPGWGQYSKRRYFKAGIIFII